MYHIGDRGFLEKSEVYLLVNPFNHMPYCVGLRRYFNGVQEDQVDAYSQCRARITSWIHSHKNSEQFVLVATITPDCDDFAAWEYWIKVLRKGGGVIANSGIDEATIALCEAFHQVTPQTTPARKEIAQHAHQCSLPFSDMEPLQPQSANNRAGKKRVRANFRQPFVSSEKRSGETWFKAEDDDLANQFLSDMDPDELAFRHERTLSSIMNRLLIISKRREDVFVLMRSRRLLKAKRGQKGEYELSAY